MSAFARPRLVAHRGASAAAPENTLAAFRRAWSLGCEAIELDVHLSADGHLVVHHDQSLVHECTLAELRALEVGGWKHEDFRGEPIPTLAEVFAAAPSGSTIFVEVKAPPATAPAIGGLLAAIVADQAHVRCALQSFDPGVLAQLSAQLPGVAAFWTVGAPRQGERVVAYPAIVIERARAMGFAGVALDARGVTEPILEEASSLGLLVDLWTVNDAEAIAAWLARREIRWLETDVPELAVEPAPTQAPAP